MSTAEWNVVGLILNLVGVLTLLRYGLPFGTPQPNSTRGWIGLVLLIAGTLCQLWANIRWVT